MYQSMKIPFLPRIVPRIIILTMDVSSIYPKQYSLSFYVWPVKFRCPFLQARHKMLLLQQRTQLHNLIGKDP